MDSASVVVAAAALVAMILTVNRTEDVTDTAAGQDSEPQFVVTEVDDPEQSDLGDLGSADESDPLSDGPVDAPVSLVVYSDYQCPYCAAWSQDTLPTMLDVDRFTADMNSKDTSEAVADNAAEGTDLGAFSTPTFILDGQPYVGAQPTDVFVDAVEAAMKGQN